MTTKKQCTHSFIWQEAEDENLSCDSKNVINSMNHFNWFARYNEADKGTPSEANDET